MARDEPELERNAVRYSMKPLPPYRYLPGLHPHPVANPHGHSHGVPDEPHPAWDPKEWRTLDDWLYGVDLCNHHYYWESHEAWEGLWLVVPRRSVPHRFLQGMIKLSAALLKVHPNTIRNLLAERRIPAVILDPVAEEPQPERAT